MKLKSYFVLPLLAGLAAAGCTEIQEYPDGRMDFDHIFQNPKLVGGYVNSCYIPAVTGYSGIYGNTTYMASVTDEAHDTDDATGGPMYAWNSGFATPFTTPWGVTAAWDMYTPIRACNVLVDRVESATIHLPVQREMYRAEARGLRSWYYFTLLKNYGGVPLILSESERATLTPEELKQTPDALFYSGEHQDDWSGARKSSYAQVVRAIIRDSRYVMANTAMGWHSGTTDNGMCRWNKGMSAGLMSRAALYAASPLNADGTFTWAEAAAVCKEALDLCLANGYSLVKIQPKGDFLRYSYNPYDLYFITTIDAKGTSDTESIIYPKQRLGMWQWCGLPSTAGQERAGACPSQELVDSYETLDGEMPILGYSDADHLKPIINPKANYDEKNPYANRDPRLMASIYYNGARLMPLEDGKFIDISESGAHSVSATLLRHTRTGYYIRKFSSPASSRNGNNDGTYRVMRLAELYLNYAEAANEAASATAPNEAVDAVNAVRERVGMPKLPYGMSKDEFRTRVRNERRVELAYEGHRFYDVRRWKILDQTDRLVTGIRLNAAGEYERFVVSRRAAFTDKFLRLPIPGKEVAAILNQTGTNIQNPGWE